MASKLVSISNVAKYNRMSQPLFATSTFEQVKIENKTVLQ